MPPINIYISELQYIMERIVSVALKPYKQLSVFLCSDPFITKNSYVIVEAPQGIVAAQVSTILEKIPETITSSTVQTVIRKATHQDLLTVKKNETLARTAYLFCKTSIRKRTLPMKLSDTEVLFDCSKFIFYFTAPTRVDFRDLIKDLTQEYHAKIELCQIGERQESQLIGAIGSCGMVCCCKRFLKNFTPISIKAAKEQSSLLNPERISGACGKLLCCLNYERENYTNFYKKAPKVGRKYMTNKGTVRVLRSNMILDSITVLDASNKELEIQLNEWETYEPQQYFSKKQPSTTKDAPQKINKDPSQHTSLIDESVSSDRAPLQTEPI